MLEELWDAGFALHNRHRVPQPLALIVEDRVIVTTRRAGVSLAKLIESRAPEAVGMIEEAGAWLGELHSADVRIGGPWFPWKSVDAIAPHLRAHSRLLRDHMEEIRSMVQRS